MKKTTVSALLALALYALTLLYLTGCGGKNSGSDPNAGVYRAESFRVLGMEMSPGEDFDGDEFFIELLDNGTAELSYQDKSYSMKWTLHGDKFTAKGGGVELSGTLANGVLDVGNIMDMGMDVRFVCRELAAAAPAAEETNAGDASLNETQFCFLNTMGTAVDGVYISNSDDWGEPVYDGVIEAGGSVLLDVSVLPDGPGIYDVGATDVNGRNYDVYDVPLDGGRIVNLYARGDTAYIMVIAGDGKQGIFEGKAYDPDGSGD